MWIIAKINYKEISSFKMALRNILKRDLEFYEPHVAYAKKFKKKMGFKTIKKFIFGNYIFCKSDSFKNISIINSLRFTRGLEYFLSGYLYNQAQINKFINFCKIHEGPLGNLKQSFFSNLIITKGIFLSGPFTNLIFEIINNNNFKKKNKIQALCKNKKITIDLNGGELFLPT